MDKGLWRFDETNTFWSLHILDIIKRRAADAIDMTKPI